VLYSGELNFSVYTMRKDDPKIHLLPPPPPGKVAEPPPHLEEPERALWHRALNEYQFRAETERAVLAEALTSRMRARHCRERIDDEGEALVEPHFGRVVAHPLLKDERAYRKQFADLLARLRIILP
jgi:hypothetical protein